MEEENGNCFEIAAKVALDMGGGIGKDGDDVDRAHTLLAMFDPYPELLVCHGLVTRSTDQRRHAHAWVEFTHDGGDWVIDTSNGKHYLGQAISYHRVGGITDEDTYCYTPKEVRECLLVHEVWGPWEDELMNLTWYKATGT